MRSVSHSSTSAGWDSANVLVSRKVSLLFRAHRLHPNDGFVFRDRICDLHVCPGSAGHCHQTNSLLFALKSKGVAEPFFVWCHWAASSGNFAPNDVSRVRWWPEHFGQPLPRERRDTVASHSCCFAQIQTTRRLLPGRTSVGPNRFFVGCHSAAIAGNRAARESSGAVLCPEQYEQP